MKTVVMEQDGKGGTNAGAARNQHLRRSTVIGGRRNDTSPVCDISEPGPSAREPGCLSQCPEEGQASSARSSAQRGRLPGVKPASELALPKPPMGTARPAVLSGGPPEPSRLASHFPPRVRFAGHEDQG